MNKHSIAAHVLSTSQASFLERNRGTTHQSVLLSSSPYVLPLGFVWQPERYGIIFQYQNISEQQTLANYVASEEEQAYRGLVKGKLQTIKKRLKKLIRS